MLHIFIKAMLRTTLQPERTTQQTGSNIVEIVNVGVSNEVSNILGIEKPGQPENFDFWPEKLGQIFALKKEPSIVFSRTVHDIRVPPT